MYLKAGGKPALVANFFTDLRGGTPAEATIAHAKISLICNAVTARERLRRLADLGVDDALLVCPWDAPEQLDDIRALL